MFNTKHAVDLGAGERGGCFRQMATSVGFATALTGPLNMFRCSPPPP